MNKLLVSYFITSLFLLVSCQKDELLPTEAKGDYRDQLVGSYKGTITYKDVAVSNEDARSTVSKETVDDQIVKITKSPNQDNALVIDGNELNLITQTFDDQNNYSDIFLYSAQDCSGTETYSLIFYPEENRLSFNYKHNRNCTIGALKQNSVFEGSKQ